MGGVDFNFFLYKFLIKKIKRNRNWARFIEASRNQATWEKNAAENQREGVGVDWGFFESIRNKQNTLDVGVKVSDNLAILKKDLQIKIMFGTA